MEANNMKAMREALEQIANLMDRILVRTELDDEIHRIALEYQNMADGVLLLSPRNCDVGTADEWADRFLRFCNSHYKNHGNCFGCAALKFRGRCEFAWAQMPYEEGGER